VSAPIAIADLQGALPVVQVGWRDQPFTGKPRAAFVPEGTSIADIAAMLGLPAHLLRDGVAIIERGGQQWRVPRSEWRYVKPKSGRCTVAFALDLQRGDRTLALIATVVVAIAAAAIAGPAAGFLGFTAGTLSFSVASAAIATAITLGGALAINALTSVPTLQDPSTFSQSDSAAAPAGGNKSAALTGNALSPGGPVARVIGSHRVYPSLCTPVLIEAIGDDEVAEMVCGLAGPHAQSEPRLGNVNADDIEDLEIELCDGLPESSIQSLVTRQGITAAVNLELRGHRVDLTTQTSLLNQDDPSSDLPQWHPLVSRVGPDEIWITIGWSQGLFISDAPAIETNQAFRVRFRKRGDVAWTNCPEVHFSHNRVGSVQRTIRLQWGDMPAAPSIPPSGFGPKFAYKSVAAQDASPGPVRGGWTANSYFSKGASNNLLSTSTFNSSNVANTELKDDRVIFWLDPDTFPQDGVYEVQVMRSQVYRDSTFTPAAYTIGGVIYDLFGYYDSSGVHRTINDQSKYLGRVGVGRFSSVWNDNPIETNDFATVSVKVRNRSVEQLSVLAAGYTYDWDGTGWNTVITTSNPAPHFREVLVGSLSADPMPAELVDDTGLVDWRSRCASNTYTCNAVIQGRTASAVLDMLAACGFAKKRQSERWGVIVDRDRSAESPVQQFNPRNMAGFRFFRPFLRLPHGLRVRFDDSEDDYKEREIIVMDPLGEQNPTSLRLEDRRYDGPITEAEARVHALREMKIGHYRFKYWTGDVAADILRCETGDLVGVQHDVLSSRDAGYARIRDVRVVGGNVVGLRLDGTIPLPDEDAFKDAAEAFANYGDAFAAPRTGIAIRCLDQSLLTAEITAGLGSATEVTFVTPFADPGRNVIDSDCLIQSGPISSEYTRLLLADIDYRKGGLRAQVTFQPEGRELWPLDIFAPADIFNERDVFRGNT
jgi:hypothetical protein